MSNSLPSRDALLVFDKVSIAYPSRHPVPVLDNFSLQVSAGTFLTVVGPSGCGKSSLLHCTAGFLRPLSGAVLLGRKPILEPTLEIGFVSQRYSLFPWLTVEANIAFGLRTQKRPEDEVHHAVDHLLDVIGLTTQRHYYPEQLSGGMQQRVALARAMAPKPPVLLLDEPFSALDAENRQKMRDLLLLLWMQDGTTVLFVTHDIEEALMLGDKVLMLKPTGGLSATLDVPFQRPRARKLPYSDEFQGLADSISRNYGSAWQ